MVRLFLFPLLLFWAVSAQAATLDTGADPGCPGRLSGQIARGDAARVAEWITAEYAAQPPAEHPDPVTLCLDSPGGSLAEALEIGRLLYARSIGTRLGPGATCLSSCALIFMMGTDQYLGHAGGEMVGPRRAMHPTARLGFHRPELRLPPSDARRNDADVERSFDLAIQATLVLVELANLPTFEGVMIPADLIQAMFTHRGADFYEIDTTGKAGRWDITLEGVDWPQTMDRLGLFNACNNLVAWEHSYIPFYDVDEVGGLTQAVELVSAGETALYAVNGVFWNYEDTHSCVIAMNPLDRALRICGAAPARAVTLGQSECLHLREVDPMDTEAAARFEIVQNPVIFLGPDTPLRHAPVVLEGQAARGAKTWFAQADGTGGLRRRCYALEMTAEIRGVQNFATLRDLPGFEHEVVAELAPGTRVERVSLPAAERAHVPDGPDNCARICANTQGVYSAMANSATTHDMGPINACFEANRVWYAVRAPSGATGWISGKFLRY